MKITRQIEPPPSTAVEIVDIRCNLCGETCMERVYGDLREARGWIAASGHLQRPGAEGAASGGMGQFFSSGPRGVGFRSV
jgi:hypothetical protein